MVAGAGIKILKRQSKTTWGSDMSKHIAVIGSRNFADYAMVTRWLNYVLSGRGAWTIISGGARGADSLAQQYADEHGVEFKLFPADWDTHGRKAGFLRNTEMARACGMVLAFWDMQSSGTAHMIQTALRHGKPVTIVPLVVGKKIQIGQ